MSDNFQYFQISQKGILLRDGKCLILECSAKPGVWDFPGGRIDKGEYGEPALRREIKEELGFDDFVNAGVAGYDIWYLADGTPVCGIVNIIYNDDDEINISAEHCGQKFITEAEIDTFKYVWPQMNKLLRAAFKQHKMLSKYGR